MEYDDNELRELIAAERDKNEVQDDRLDGLELKQDLAEHDHPHDHPDLEYDDKAVKDAIRRNGELIDDLKKESRQGDADIKKELAEHDERITALEEGPKPYDNIYRQGSYQVAGEYEFDGGKLAWFNETDAEGNDFVFPGDTWLVSCDDGPIMKLEGVDPGTNWGGFIAVDWQSGQKIGGEIKLGVVNPVAEHEHDDYATKSDLESLEAELELLAKTLESGQWQVIDNPGPRAGEMWIALNQLNNQENQIVLNNEDVSGTNHGWATLHEGDYVEILDKSDQQGRSIEHDYGLFVVKGVEKTASHITIDLELYSSNGDCMPGETFEVSVLDIAESELDMASLDARYIRKEADNSTYKDWLLKADGNKKNPDDFAPKHSHPYASSTHTHSLPSHTHSYASTSHKHDSDYATSNHTHSVIFRSGTSTNPSLSKGEPFLNTTYKVIYVGT
jgi:hypothetical protein